MMIKALLIWATSAGFIAMTAGSVAAQDSAGGQANFETGASYSSLRGGIAFIGLNADNLFGRGLDLGLGYQAGEDGSALNANISQVFRRGDTAFGQNTSVRATLTGRASDWSSQDYSLAHYGAEIAVGAQSDAGLRYSLRAFWQSDTLDDFDDNISPLAATPLDNSTAIGVGGSLGYSTYTENTPLAVGLDVQGSVSTATALGDREWIAAELSWRYGAPLPYGVVLAMKAEAGLITEQGGTAVNIVDRAFIGNPMPRGFAYTGIGPRDVFGDNINTALGGNNYMTSSVEVRFPTPIPAVTLGVFADAGAVWGLDETTGGASGTIDDSYYLRSSAGVSIYWDTPIGLLQINAAEPINKQPNDEIEEVSINLNFQF
jgi:outer membrane protein insertion porin family